MSVEAMAAVLHHSKATGTAKLVLLGIANHDGDGGAWPTVATLAKYANTSERGTQKAIARLVELGELRVDRQQGGTADYVDALRPNRYHVLVRCPTGCDGTTRHQVAGQALTVVDNPLAHRVNVGSPGERGFTGAGERGFTQTTQEPSPQLQVVPRATTPVVHRPRPCRDHLGAGVRTNGECAGCWADHVAVPS